MNPSGNVTIRARGDWPADPVAVVDDLGVGVQ
jgi:hypothetical protein